MSGLVYYPDDQPGIRRQRRGRGFTYIAQDGTTIADQSERKRLAAMAVPPAYEDVWMCPLENGHLQATGRDAKRRKQYRYHPDWTAERAKTKFEGLVDFGHCLPAIRRRVRKDLKSDPGEKPFALASAVALIDRLSLRVGHDDYTRENGSFGALTLRNRHLSFDDDGAELRFTAKGGKKVTKGAKDRYLMRLLQKIDDLPGATLLTWQDSRGTPQALQSDGLNDYLAEAAKNDAITAKTFRTWAGTVAAYEVALSGGASIKTMAEAACKRLHNSPLIARNSYIHPKVIDLAGQDFRPPRPVELAGLKVSEQKLLGFLA